MKCHTQTEGKERINNSVFCGEHGSSESLLMFWFRKIDFKGGNDYDFVKLFYFCLVVVSNHFLSHSLAFLSLLDAKTDLLSAESSFIYLFPF